jgi:hypothetical protein
LSNNSREDATKLPPRKLTLRLISNTIGGTTDVDHAP